MLGGIFPSAGQITKKALLLVLAVPEGLIMLFIAVVLDLLGFVCFILDLFGVGIPISFLIDAAGNASIGIWAMMRPLARSVIGKIGEKAGEVVGGKGSASGGSAVGKAAKKGISTGLTIVRFIITDIIELIPYVGDVVPAWTFFVIFTLIEGEITS